MGVHAVTVVVATLVVVMGTKAALAQLTCSFNSPVAAQKNFNVNDLEGTWYTRYTSQSSSDVSNVKLIETIMKEVNTGGQRYIKSSRRKVFTNNKCDKATRNFDLHADQGYFVITITHNGDTYVNHNYVLGLSSNVLVNYSTLTKNGAGFQDIVYVMTKSSTASFTLTSTMKSNLNALCGGTAASSLSSYTTVNADTSAVCT